MIRGIAITVTMLLGVAVIARQDQTVVPKCPPITAESRDGFLASDCKHCHDITDVTRRTTDHADAGVYGYIRADEFDLWNGSDPHHRAYAVLSEPRAVQMGRLLEIEPHQHAACLTCHAVDYDLQKPLKEKRRFTYKSGVGCEACHGNAKGWNNEHQNVRNWMDFSPESAFSAEKIASFGLNDLRDPVKRANICVGCHVGNSDEGKVVTHAMYAAGHPPLLQFELATFGRDQPTHRKDDPNEFIRKVAAQNPALAASRFHYRVGELSPVRALAVGAVTTLRDTLKLIGDEAKNSAKDHTGLDFAHFDCFACHHGLEIPSERQARGYVGTPGRPMMRPLPTVVVAAVLAHSQSKGQPERLNEFHRLLGELNRAFGNQPFGELAAIDGISQWLIRAADEWLKDLDAVTYDDAARKQLLDLLVKSNAATKWDYDSAQQAAWAVRVLSEPDQSWRRFDTLTLAGAGWKPADLSADKIWPRRFELRRTFRANLFIEAWNSVR